MTHSTLRIPPRQGIFFLLGLLGLIAFFLTWIGKEVSASGLDVFAEMAGGRTSAGIVMLMIPLSFLAGMFFRIGIFPTRRRIGMKIVDILPFVILLASSLFINSVTGNRIYKVDHIMDLLWETFGIGFWLTGLVATILVFAPGWRRKNEEADAAVQKEDFITRMCNAALKPIARKPRLGALLFVSLIVAYSCFHVFYLNAPERVAERMADATCACIHQYNEDLKNAYTNYIEDFESKGFATRRESRDALEKLKMDVELSKVMCHNKVRDVYAFRARKFARDDAEEKMFRASLDRVRESCPDKDPKNEELELRSAQKILTIEEPVPDLARISADLEKMKFNRPRMGETGEYSNVQIVESKLMEGQAQYKVTARVRDPHDNMSYDMELMIEYRNSDTGWYITQSETEVMTATYTLLPDTWIEIDDIVSRISFDNTYNLLWEVNHVDEQFKTGPGVPKKEFPLAYNYKIKSLEKVPVELTLRFEVGY